jgi:hypothetical protein
MVPDAQESWQSPVDPSPKSKLIKPVAPLQVKTTARGALPEVGAALKVVVIVFVPLVRTWIIGFENPGIACPTVQSLSVKVEVV